VFGFEGIGLAVADGRVEIAVVVVGERAIEGGEEGGRAGPFAQQTSPSLSVLRNRSVSALPLGLL
jgi:hypothetical protein